MPFLGATLNTAGILFLSHAVYSTHEHTASSPSLPLPTDIVLELLLSIFVLSTGIVLSSPNLKPIQWAQWSGKIEREGRQSEGGGWTREGEEVLGEGDPYEFLGLDGAEGRRGFWDVRAKRKEYADWVRAGGTN